MKRLIRSMASVFAVAFFAAAGGCFSGGDPSAPDDVAGSEDVGEAQQAACLQCPWWACFQHKTQATCVNDTFCGCWWDPDTNICENSCY